MATMETDQNSPREKLKLHTGECLAIGCSYGCNEFVNVAYTNGFFTCICGHTKNAHRRVGATPTGETNAD